MSSRLRVAAVLILLLGASCVSHRHTIGLGATGTGVQTGRQFYILFGLFSANEVSSQRMADGVTSYEVETKYSFWDFVMQPLLLPLTMTSRTVTVRT